MAESQPRFSEKLSYQQASIPAYVGVTVASFLLTGIGPIIAGVWLLGNRDIPTIILAGVVAGGLLFVGIAGFVFYLMYFRKFILEVHDSGVYYRSPLMRQLRHVPIEQITDVTWEKGTVRESDIITFDEIWGDRGDSLKEVSTPALRVYNHACDLEHENPSPMTKEIRFGVRMDRATEGIVRVDDADNEAVHLLGTDHPEQLANSIETARNLST